MTFFIHTQFKAVLDRKKHFDAILGEPKNGEEPKFGLYRSFLKQGGLIPSRPHEEIISYRMVEKVVVEQRTLYPGSFGFDQIELVLRQVRTRMKVDEIAKVATKKMCYGTN